MGEEGVAVANKIVHFELMGEDAKGLNGFYTDLFGWKTQPAEGFENYFLIDADDTGIGGAVGTGPEGFSSYLTFYIEVDSIDEHLGKIEASGGKTVMPRTEVPGVVTFAMFSDPAGNTVGLVEAGSGT